jgi:hypothetical protein
VQLTEVGSHVVALTTHCYSYRLDGPFPLPAAGYELFYKDYIEPGWEHHTLAPPTVDTLADIVSMAGVVGQARPRDDIQSLDWTLVGIQIHANAEPKAIDGGDHDTFFIAMILHQQAAALTSSREVQALTLLALAVEHE